MPESPQGNARASLARMISSSRSHQVIVLGVSAGHRDGGALVFKQSEGVIGGATLAEEIPACLREVHRAGFEHKRDGSTASPRTLRKCALAPRKLLYADFVECARVRGPEAVRTASKCLLKRELVFLCSSVTSVKNRKLGERG